MAGMSVDGLASGLNTTELISQLMQMERIPQTQLQNRMASVNKVITALQGVNTRAASLTTAAEKLADPKTWTALAGSSSDDSVAIATKEGVVASSVTLESVKVAAAHSVATDTITWPPPDGVDPGSATITVKRGDTTVLSVTPDTGDPREIAAAINEQKAGITATALQVEPGKYRLQLTATETGAANAFTVEGLGTTSVVRQARDAEISLGGGLVVKSASNTFTDLIPGTTITVSKDTANVVVEVKNDTKGISDAASAFASSLNIVLQDIKSQSRAPVSGDSTSSAGVLLGNSTIRGLTQSLLSAASGMVGEGTEAVTVASLGLEITRGGEVTFDEKKFAELLTEKPELAQKLTTALADRVGEVADGASNPTDGSLTQLISNRQGTVRDLTTQIENWDRRLDVRESALRRQYSALEVALSNMNSQSSWLAGQLASLSGLG